MVGEPFCFVKLKSPPFTVHQVSETDVITFDTTDGGTTYLASHAIDGAK